MIIEVDYKNSTVFQVCNCVISHQNIKTIKISYDLKWFSYLVFTADLTSFLLILKELKSLKIINEKNNCKWQFTPEKKEDNLDPTDDGEASEESHGASNEAQLCLRLDLLVSLDVVEGGRVKVDLH